MNGKLYTDVEAIQKACTNILKDDLKNSFDMPLDHAHRCIESQGKCFKLNKKILLG